MCARKISLGGWGKNRPAYVKAAESKSQALQDCVLVNGKACDVPKTSDKSGREVCRRVAIGPQNTEGL